MFLDNKPTPLVSNFKFRENRNRSKEVGRMFTTWCPKTMSFDYHKENGHQVTGAALGCPDLQDPRDDLRNNTIYMQKNLAKTALNDKLSKDHKRKSAMEKRSESTARVTANLRIQSQRTSSMGMGSPKKRIETNSSMKMLGSPKAVKTHWKGATSL
jgi:hypothetical protein